MNALLTTYREVQVEYLENENKWVFTLRGRERKVESLAKAKEAIDAPAKEDKPAFTRQPAFFRNGWGSLPVLVDVTSIAEGCRYDNNPYFWIVKTGQKDSSKTRSKECSTNLFANTPENAERISRMEKLDKEIEQLHAMRSKLVDKLTPFEAQ